MAEVDTMSSQLDQILLQLFEKLDQRLQQWIQLENLMKDGFLNISKARYSMGNKSVTPLQYPTDMEAIARVLMESSEDKNYEEFKIIRSKLSDRINDKQSKKDDEAKSALRRRKGESDNGEAVDKLTQQIDKLKVDKKEAKANQISNPLHWFGILVPPSLRSAQKEFENAIDICAEMASLQQEIYLLIDNFKSIKVKLGSDLNGKKIASQDITLSEEEEEEKDDDDIPPQEADRNT